MVDWLRSNARTILSVLVLCHCCRYLKSPEARGNPDKEVVAALQAMAVGAAGNASGAGGGASALPSSFPVSCPSGAVIGSSKGRTYIKKACHTYAAPSDADHWPKFHVSRPLAFIHDPHRLPGFKALHHAAATVHEPHVVARPDVHLLPA